MREVFLPVCDRSFADSDEGVRNPRWRVPLRPMVMRRWVALVALVVACVGLGGFADSALGAVTAYVANYTDGTVTPINTATNTAGKPIGTNGHPHDMVAAPDGKTVYAMDIQNNAVEVIDTATNKVTDTIMHVPSAFEGVITPGGKTLYVSTVADRVVTPINTATDTAGTPINVCSGTAGMAVTPNGHTLYVACSGEYSGGGDTVVPVNVATNTAGTPITVGMYPSRIAITPNGATAYVTNSTVDSPSGTVTPIDIATNTAGAPITVGPDPVGVAVTPNGRTAYVVGYSSSMDSTAPGYVVPISTATNTAEAQVSVTGQGESVGITPDGSTAYVTSGVNGQNGLVTPINTATDTAGTPIGVGVGPTDIAFVNVHGGGGGRGGGGGGTAVGTTTVGHPSVKGDVASVPVSCAGSAGAKCVITGALSATEKLKGGKVIAVVAGKKKTKTRVVHLGKTTVTLTAGHHLTLRIALSAAGKRLLNAHHKLPVKLTVTSFAGGKTKTLASKTVTFMAKRAKH